MLYEVITASIFRYLCAAMKENKLQDSASLRDFFRSTTVFRHLSEAELNGLPLHSVPDTYKRGAVIYQEGSRISGFYVVFQGVIKIYKTGNDGKDQIIRFAKPGDIMGFVITSYSIHYTKLYDKVIHHFFHKAQSAFWVGVASIGQCVYVYVFQSVVFGNIAKFKKVMAHGMNPSGSDKPNRNNFV